MLLFLEEVHGCGSQVYFGTTKSTGSFNQNSYQMSNCNFHHALAN